MKNNFFPFPQSLDPQIIILKNVRKIYPADFVYESGEDTFSIIVEYKTKKKDLDIEYESAELRDKDFLNICNLILGKNEAQNRNIV